MPPTARRRQLEVWGDPIQHSRSPALHAAAYAVLDMPWSYARRRVSADTFDRELAGLDASFRGLSLTYPLKACAFAASGIRDRRAELTGAVNTLLLEPEGFRGFNTDIGGIVRALGEAGIESVDRVRVVGAGATASSAIVAVAELGAHHVEVVARRPAAVAPLQALGDALGVVVLAVPFAAPGHAPVPLTISTVPGDAEIPDAAAGALADSGGLLLDVVYGHWPTVLAQAWQRAGGTAHSGLGMLVHQALLQVRIFVGGEVDVPLDDESAVLAAMRQAVVGD
ncbi:shikimate dehydrogenase [Microbacterium sp. P5_E9]